MCETWGGIRIRIGTVLMPIRIREAKTYVSYGSGHGILTITMKLLYMIVTGEVNPIKHWSLLDKSHVAIMQKKF
jgi:hypothetical protein